MHKGFIKLAQGSLMSSGGNHKQYSVSLDVFGSISGVIMYCFGNSGLRCLKWSGVYFGFHLPPKKNVGGGIMGVKAKPKCRDISPNPPVQKEFENSDT